MEVSSADKYEGAFKEAVKARSSALAEAQDALAGSNLKLIADLAIKHRLPASYPRGEFVDNGGLMSYGPDLKESFERAADLAARIFKGAKPADLPFEQPTRYPFVVNLKAAKASGIELPVNLVALADEVIE